MDILHHSIIGVIGLTVATSVDQSMAGIFFLIGSIFPDLDAFLVLVSSRFYLKNHQGFSHALPFAPLYALVSMAIFSFWIEPTWLIFFSFILGFTIHVLLDYSNTYGITLLYPLSKKRFSLDAVFFVDTPLLVLSGLMLWLQFPLLVYVITFTLYILFKMWLQRRVKKELKAKFAIPSALNPFEFYLYHNENETITTYRYNAITHKEKVKKEQKNQDKKWLELTKKSTLFQDISSITKAFHITSVTQTDTKTTIEAKDLALRNFGGKFATTKLEFNKEKELTDEVSSI